MCLKEEFVCSVNIALKSGNGWTDEQKEEPKQVNLSSGDVQYGESFQESMSQPVPDCLPVQSAILHRRHDLLFLNVTTQWAHSQRWSGQHLL